MHFWTTLQLAYYKSMASKGPLTIHFDATGGIVRKVPDFQGKASPILYYAGVCNKIPVVQMLSERQHTAALAYWLQQWAAQVPVPSTVVTDFSLALMSACSMAFSGGYLQHYLLACLDVLEGRKERLPATYLRLDCVHMIHAVATAQCFKACDPDLKKFYLYCFARLIVCESMSAAEGILQNICVVASSKRLTKACTAAVQFLKQCVADATGKCLQH